MSTQELRPGEEPFIVYTLSDASGQTAEMVTKAAVSQFAPKRPIKIVRLPRVVSQHQLVNMVKLGAQQPCMFAYTFVRADLREALAAEAAKFNLPAVDLLGSMLVALSHTLEIEPMQEAGLLHTKDEEYFKRMDAIDFAIKYDDGKSPDGLVRADLVLVGVSRTSKTPTCMYLAQNQGLRTANVPLVPGTEPPAQLFSLRRPIVVGLIVSPDRLIQIRRNRLLSLNEQKESSYIESDSVREEIIAARRLFERMGWPVIDVSRRSVEETAAAVINLLNAARTKAQTAS